MIWAGRIISALIAMFLLMDGVMKLLKPEPVVTGTVELGYPESVIVPLGIALLASVVLYIIPRTAVLGAILLTGYLGGAVATHVRVLHPLFSHTLFPVYMGVLLWLGLVLRDARLRSLLPLRGGTAHSRFSVLLVLSLATLTFALSWPAAAHQATREAGSAKPRVREIGVVTSTDGTQIAFEKSGSGPVLILVSGALSSRFGGRPLAALLSRDFTVMNYDRRGRGNSGDTQPYAVEREIEDIEALIDHAGGSAYLFGASSGAALALDAASKLPTKVTKAVLFEPPFIVDSSRPPMPPDFVEHVTALVAADRRGDAVAYFMTDAVRVPPEHVEQMKQTSMWAGMEKLAQTLAYDGSIVREAASGKPLPKTRWASATMPILVLDGGNSEPWMHTGSKQLKDVLPNAKSRTLEGQDHSASFTAPQVLAPVLVEFFTE
jgi:pimeloyl-ACP methyl ester carboxylesterase